MTFSAYIQRQKSIIRSHRAVENQTQKDEPPSNSDKIFKELSLMKGLNTKERERA